MLLRVGYLNNLTGTVFAGFMLTMSLGNINSWTSPVLPKLQNTTSDNLFNQPVTATQGSWMSSLITVGAIVGCWLFAFISDTMGRRMTFLTTGVVMVLGYTLMLILHKIEVFYVARFFQGVGVGGGFNILTTYFVEITSKTNRGLILTLIGMTTALGSLFCYGVGPYVSITFLNAIQMIFPVNLLIWGIIFSEESPYFYLIKNKEELARKVLRIYRGSDKEIEEDIKEMKEQVKKQREGNIMDVIKTKAYFKSFVIGNVLVMGQQLTGINGILMYSQTIFDLTGSSLSPEVCPMILAALQATGGAIAPLITNKFDKIPILLSSGAGMIISESILGIYCILRDSGKNLETINFIPVLCLTGFMLSYNFGFGPLCWLVAGELYPIRMKMVSSSISITLYFILFFFIAQFFSTAVETIGIGAIFLIFAGCCLATCLFIKLFAFETRGITLEEIQNILNKTNPVK